MVQMRIQHSVAWLILPFLWVAAGCITHEDSRRATREASFYEPPGDSGDPVKVVDAKDGLKASVMEAGTSAEGRPIRAYILGEGDRNVILVGGIHGDEPGGEIILYRFIGFVSKQPDLIKGYKAVVMPALNPDGLEYQTRFNSRGVDLNLNFPSQDWGVDIRTGDRTVIGASAGSEPETKALMAVLEKYPPALVVSIQSAAACITHEGPGAADWAKSLSESCGLPVEQFRTRPGSLKALVGNDKEIPFLTLELEFHHERGKITDTESNRFQEALLVLFRNPM